MFLALRGLMAVVSALSFKENGNHLTRYPASDFLTLVTHSVYNHPLNLDPFPPALAYLGPLYVRYV